MKALALAAPTTVAAGVAVFAQADGLAALPPGSLLFAAALGLYVALIRGRP